MGLTCECNHLRKDHQAGKTKLDDNNVTSCMTKDCHCEKYHSNYESRVKQRKILFKSGIWASLVVIGVIITGIIGNEMTNISVDNLMSNYHVIAKYHTLHKLENGTLTNSTNYYDNENPTDLIKDSAWVPLSMILLIFGMLAAFFVFNTYYDFESRKLIQE